MAATRPAPRRLPGQAEGHLLHPELPPPLHFTGGLPFSIRQ